jgi:hypothetical protein
MFVGAGAVRVDSAQVAETEYGVHRGRRRAHLGGP